MTDVKEALLSLKLGLPLDPMPPAVLALDPSVPHAPKRPINLTPDEFKLALKNSLRYFPEEHHELLAPEFAEELRVYGHIYHRRFRPTNYAIKAYSLDMYPCKCKQAASIQLMIMNNLSDAIAQFPQELVTYGGNGTVFSNWAQYHLVMKYLCEMTEEQTLVLYSGHPLGLFPSTSHAPRVIVSNGMVIPNYSSREMYEKMYAQGVTQYGQMTAGSFCYIGPQGIVHGTTITVLNASRKYLNKNDLGGVCYVTSGLGGMSGAQGKASTISGCVGVICEVDEDALKKRYNQGWIQEIQTSATECIARMKVAKKNKEAIAIGFHGNVVTLWEALADEDEMIVELGSDQTSLHNPWMGGYYPVQISFEDSRAMMRDDPKQFKGLVEESLRRHVAAINKLTKRGLRFWDYGNAFLYESYKAGAEIMKPETGGLAPEDGGKFKYPSYVQDIMGDVFSLGFGPFRWVCTSGDPKDLETTDAIAADVFRKLMVNANEKAREQYNDNLKWILEAGKNKMVVGSQARILYSNCEGRTTLAVEFNRAVASGRLSMPVVLSRDHHDVSGTDSPYRETSNIYDGSVYCADMAIQNVIGDAARGATWVSIHNGGGVGWGEVINGGFGMTLDGSDETEAKCRDFLNWDVCNGVSRRSWAGNENAILTIKEEMEREAKLVVTMPNFANEGLLDKCCADGTVSSVDLLLTNCKIVAMGGGEEIVEGGAIGVLEGKIAWVGRMVELPENMKGCRNVKDCGGKLVTPGLIDCHTHVVYGGNRCGEWELKLKGATYEEVAKSGGGIVNTVEGTRNASVDELVGGAERRVKALLSEGVTSMDIKSGYGLNLEGERKMLLAARKIGESMGVKVSKTFLAAHATPKEFAGREDEYIELCCEMMGGLVEEGLVDCCDAFCESIGFSVEQTSRVYARAVELGVPIRLHGDQLNDFGGGELASKFKALSCDHCEYSGDAAIAAMAEAGVVAVLLPTANYFIKEKRMPDVQQMRERGVEMAIATNNNPGSSPCSSILLTMNMGCTRFGMTPMEALKGVTCNAAKAMGLGDSVGSIMVGKCADLCVWDADEVAELSYYMGLNLLNEVYVDGVARK